MWTHPRRILDGPALVVTPGVRRLMLRMLEDAIGVLQDSTRYRQRDYEAYRTITHRWFFSPEDYSDDDPLSFENIASTLRLPAGRIRRKLATGERVQLHTLRPKPRKKVR